MQAIQPVPLLLLDINMPMLNGMETLKLVKEKFRLVNERINANDGEEEKSNV